MNLFYQIWRYLYQMFSRNSSLVERMFFRNPLYLHNYNNMYCLPFYHRWFLVFFYNKKFYRKIYFFVENIETIEVYRLRTYTTSYNFLSKYFLENLHQREKKNISLLKIKTGADVKKFKCKMQSYVTLIILEKIQYSFTWRKLPSVNFGKVYFREKYTLELLNPKTVNGFFSFLGPFQKETFSSRYEGTDHYYNRIVEDASEINENLFHLNLKFYKYKDSIKKYNTFFRKLKVAKETPDAYFGDIFLKTVFISKYRLYGPFKAFYQKLYGIKYKPTDVSQYLEKSKKISSMFIRKNKIFNKGRYSRNRQLYRTGVYWCLWLNIINVFGLYYYFYRFVFNFGYFYIPLLLLILSIFGSRLVKYRFYNPAYVINEVILFIELLSKFLSEIIKNFLIRTKDLIVMLALYVYYTVLDFFQKMK